MFWKIKHTGHKNRRNIYMYGYIQYTSIYLYTHMHYKHKSKYDLYFRLRVRVNSSQQVLSTSDDSLRLGDQFYAAVMKLTESLQRYH